jgi:hypothetical protein
MRLLARDFLPEIHAGGRKMAMRRLRIGFTAVVATVSMALPLAACGADRPTPAESPATSGGAVEAERKTLEPATEKDFDRNNFSRSTTIDNRWTPLTPGMQFTFEGRANRGKGRLPHRVVFTVTDLSKVIDGVRTRVLWDQDINAGELAETELAFWAQDDDGNVWLLGEYPEEWENGKFSDAPDVWFSGVDGAKAGVMMRADPRLGTSSYRQGYAPKIEFQDRARVYQMGQRTCVPVGCYDDVLVTDEWNAVEPGDAHQRKFYAPGVGNVRVGAAGGKEQEELVLVKLSHLDAGALAQAREEALELERRAYRVRKDVYGGLPPAEHTP